MYNKDLYKRLEEKYGRERMIPFCEIVSDMYTFLENDRVERGISIFDAPEYDYESEWWGEKFEDLLYDRDLIEENNEQENR